MVTLVSMQHHRLVIALIGASLRTILEDTRGVRRATQDTVCNIINLMQCKGGRTLRLVQALILLISKMVWVWHQKTTKTRTGWLEKLIMLVKVALMQARQSSNKIWFYRNQLLCERIGTMQEELPWWIIMTTILVLRRSMVLTICQPHSIMKWYPEQRMTSVTCV